MEWGSPGPQGLMHHLAMAWMINHWPLPRLIGLVPSWDCLPTQLTPPTNVNAASLASPRLIPSPRDCLL